MREQLWQKKNKGHGGRLVECKVEEDAWELWMLFDKDSAGWTSDTMNDKKKKEKNNDDERDQQYEKEAIRGRDREREKERDICMCGQRHRK